LSFSLAGKTIVFSHVIPLQQQKQPESHPAYRLGTELGASIANSVGPTVTHIVAGSNGTDKVRWARGKPAVHAVSVDWLASCGYLWRQADERATPVEAAPPPGAARIGPDFKGTLAPPQMR